MSIYEHCPDLAQDLFLFGYDGKNIVDAAPAMPEVSFADLAALYDRQSSEPDFNMPAFVAAHMAMRDECIGEGYVQQERLLPYTNQLIMANRFHNPVSAGTYVGLPHASLQPCPGRFANEQYAHDTGKVIQGLAADTAPFEVGDETALSEEYRWSLIRGMVDNQVYLQQINGKNGHCIPTANRTYFMSRPQDSRFAHNIRLLAQHFESSGVDPLSLDHPFVQYLPALETEWLYWNGGRRHFSRSSVIGHEIEGTVLLDSNGTFGTCYQDRDQGPRLEMRGQDLRALAEARRADDSIDADMFFHHWRIGAAQAWDYTEERHFATAGDPSSIEAGFRVYVDASSRQFELEQTLAEAYELRAAYYGKIGNADAETHNRALAERNRNRAARRQEMIRQYHYDPDTGYYYDIDYRTGKRTAAVSTGGMYPLLVGAASPEEAAGAVDFFASQLVVNGMIRVTNRRSAQQWDGLWWPGEQDAVLFALQRYGYNDLGFTLADRSLQVNQAVLSQDGGLHENLDPEAPLGTGSVTDGDEGEYPRQKNFTWTATGVRVAFALRAEFLRSQEMTTRGARVLHS
jgi:alpha,alpha-trehalase